MDDWWVRGRVICWVIYCGNAEWHCRAGRTQRPRNRGQRRVRARPSFGPVSLIGDFEGVPCWNRNACGVWGDGMRRKSEDDLGGQNERDRTGFPFDCSTWTGFWERPILAPQIVGFQFRSSVVLRSRRRSLLPLGGDSDQPQSFPAPCTVANAAACRVAPRRQSCRARCYPPDLKVLHGSAYIGGILASLKTWHGPVDRMRSLVSGEAGRSEARCVECCSSILFLGLPSETLDLLHV